MVKIRDFSLEWGLRLLTCPWCPGEGGGFVGQSGRVWAAPGRARRACWCPPAQQRWWTSWTLWGEEGGTAKALAKHTKIQGRKGGIFGRVRHICFNAFWALSSPPLRPVQGSKKGHNLSLPFGQPGCTTSVLLAWSYFELAQSLVNDQTSHEHFRPRLPIRQVTDEIWLPDVKIYEPQNIGHDFCRTLL